MYPIVFNNKDELEEYIIEHSEEVLSIIHRNHAIDGFNEEVVIMAATVQEQKEEIEAMREKNKKMEEIVSLVNKRDEGQCATYIGEVQEKQIESDLRECLSEEDFNIDGDKIMHAMDIRIESKVCEFRAGLEIKDKKALTKKDITKFKDDKTSNCFDLSFFLSTTCPIPKIVTDLDTFVIKNGNEIYIYSNKKTFIQIVISAFVQQYITSGNKTDLSSRAIDMLSTLYNNWCDQKKMFYKMDKTFISCLNQFNIGLDNGHLYLASKTKCRGSKSPYN